MNWIQKLDKFWIGLVIGLVFPVIVYCCYWLFFHNQLSFPRGFYRYLINGVLLSNVIKMCAIGNLLIFYFGLTKKIDRFNKGVIVSVFFYVGLVAYVNYYLEPEFI
jgi:ACR3 family arsenite efflux pump ArsB